jgi:hypothetical protein
MEAAMVTAFVYWQLFKDTLNQIRETLVLLQTQPQAYNILDLY